MFNRKGTGGKGAHEREQGAAAWFQPAWLDGHTRHLPPLALRCAIPRAADGRLLARRRASHPQRRRHAGAVRREGFAQGSAMRPIFSLPPRCPRMSYALPRQQQAGGHCKRGCNRVVLQEAKPSAPELWALAAWAPADAAAGAPGMHGGSDAESERARIRESLRCAAPHGWGWAGGSATAAPNARDTIVAQHSPP